MEAYKPYVDYIMAGGVAESAYILSHQGAICGTSLPITEMPRYEFNQQEESDPNKSHKVIVEEGPTLVEALANKGVAKRPYGIRIYNQKYFPVRYDEESQTLYLKKDKGGACVVKTGKFILIGTFNSENKMQNGAPQNPGELNKRVEMLAADLRSKKY